MSTYLNENVMLVQTLQLLIFGMVALIFHCVFDNLKSSCLYKLIVQTSTYKHIKENKGVWWKMTASTANLVAQIYIYNFVSDAPLFWASRSLLKDTESITVSWLICWFKSRFINALKKEYPSFGLRDLLVHHMRDPQKYIQETPRKHPSTATILATFFLCAMNVKLTCREFKFKFGSRLLSASKVHSRACFQTVVVFSFLNIGSQSFRIYAKHIWRWKESDFMPSNFLQNSRCCVWYSRVEILVTEMSLICSHWASKAQ